jgi:D-serine deaminase-like pyridoxal phosphate-dependent protein
VRPDELERLRQEPIDWRHKGFPAVEGATPANVAAFGWDVLAGDLLLPALVLKRSALQHNAALMARWCAEHGASLAPHGKTTMSPELFALQLGAGAWAITAATASQARVCRRFGVPRIVLANQVVEPAAIRWLAGELAADPGCEILCLVDSLTGVEAMTGALAGAPLAGEQAGASPAGGRPVPVLVELGLPGARTGCRTVAAALEVAAAVERSPTLALAGVEAFEGVVDAGDPTAAATVDRLVADVWATAAAVTERGWVRRDEVLVSIGGSTWFDRVVAGRRQDLGVPVRLLLRSGCYLTHDSGLYRRLSPLDGRGDGPGLRHALEVWGVVLSRPEARRAVVGLGKRDVSHDVEAPIPLVVSSAGGRHRRDVEGALAVVTLNDQHAWLDVAPDDPLAVGDLVGCGISHPCTTLDKWRLIPVVDDGYRVIDAVHTFF